MIKRAMQKVLNRMQLHLVHTGRFGFELEFDLARLAGGREIATILDVGGNRGQTALRMHKIYPAATIFTFEPVPHTFKKLRANIAGQTGINSFNVAMGAQRGKARMILSGDAVANSGSNTMIANDYSANASSVEVDMETLDHFCDEQKIGQIDLLKIDVEGFELDVLAGADRLLRAGAVHFLYTECDFAANRDMPHGDFFKIHDRLSALGYSFVTFYPESFSLKFGSSHGNVLYVLTSALPKVVSGPLNNIN